MDELDKFIDQILEFAKNNEMEIHIPSDLAPEDDVSSINIDLKKGIVTVK